MTRVIHVRPRRLLAIAALMGVVALPLGACSVPGGGSPDLLRLSNVTSKGCPEDPDALKKTADYVGGLENDPLSQSAVEVVAVNTVAPTSTATSTAAPSATVDSAAQAESNKKFLGTLRAALLAKANECRAGATATPTASRTPSGQRCPVEFVQNADVTLPDKPDYRFVPGGFKGTPDEKRQQLITAAGHDYRYLAFVGSTLFHKSVDQATLVAQGFKCLSVEGQSLHAMVKGALLASTPETVQADKSSCNSGLNGGHAVVATRCGLSGNVTATRYTLPDGSTLVVLDRCGNLTFIHIPADVPRGETDEKNPAADPASHGNAGNGGGGNATSGPRTYIRPQDMQRPSATPRPSVTLPTLRPTSRPTVTAEPSVNPSTGSGEPTPRNTGTPTRPT